MALTVSARKNTLAGRTKAWRFHTSHGAKVGYEELLEIMARSRTTLSKPDIVACMTLLTETVSSLVAEGKFVKTPLGDYYLCAVGTADGPGDPFTPNSPGSGHGLRLRFRPDRGTEAAIVRTARVRRDDAQPSRKPWPLGFEALDGGDILRLRGYNLKFDPSDPLQGLFLTAGSSDPGARCPVYAAITPSLIIARLPPGLPAGDYGAVVRSATRAGTPREGGLEGRIRVGGRED